MKEIIHAGTTVKSQTGVLLAMRYMCVRGLLHPSDMLIRQLRIAIGAGARKHYLAGAPGTGTTSWLVYALCRVAKAQPDATVILVSPGEARVIMYKGCGSAFPFLRPPDCTVTLVVASSPSEPAHAC